VAWEEGGRGAPNQGGQGGEGGSGGGGERGGRALLRCCLCILTSNNCTCKAGQGRPGIRAVGGEDLLPFKCELYCCACAPVAQAHVPMCSVVGQCLFFAAHCHLFAYPLRRHLPALQPGVCQQHPVPV
jgi:hypothetical protein